MTLRYELWDVFTRQALAGNPLAVVLDGSDLSDSQMQAVAKEFNLSETSFILPSDKADVRARYFTPATELPMAGHPSIGTSYSLHRAGKVKAELLTLELGVGIIPMRFELRNGKPEKVWMEQGVPELVADVSQRAEVARALGLELSDLVDTLPIQVVSAGNAFMLVPLDSLEVLGKARLDLSLLPDVLPQNHRSVFAFTFDAPESDIRSRMFGEALGVREDPATGSAHGPLGWYIAAHKLVKRVDDYVHFESHQGVEMGRPSQLFVSVAKDMSVAVGGEAVLVGEGELYL